MKCANCQQPISTASAKFCPRCGAEAIADQNAHGGNTTLDDVVVAELVTILRAYGEASHAAPKLRGAYERVEKARQVCEAQGNAAGLGVVTRGLTELAGKERQLKEQLHNVQLRIRQFDRADVVAVRDRILNHPVVDPDTKEGLRHDELSLFK